MLSQRRVLETNGAEPLMSVFWARFDYIPGLCVKTTSLISEKVQWLAVLAIMPCLVQMVNTCMPWHVYMHSHIGMDGEISEDLLPFPSRCPLPGLGLHTSPATGGRASIWS